MRLWAGLRTGVVTLVSSSHNASTQANGWAGLSVRTGRDTQEDQRNKAFAFGAVRRGGGAYE